MRHLQLFTSITTSPFTGQLASPLDRKCHFPHFQPNSSAKSSTRLYPPPSTRPLTRNVNLLYAHSASSPDYSDNLLNRFSSKSSPLDTTSLDAALDSSTALSLSTAILRVVMQEKAGATFDKSCFERLSSVCSSLTTLNVSSSSTTDLPLSSFKQLETLQLHGFSTGAKSLPHLRSLSLWSVPEALMKQLLNPECLPSLRAFALVDPQPASATRLEETDILELLPQLDVLSLDFLVWSAMSASFREVAAVKTLVDCYNISITRVLESPSNACHLRLLNSSSVHLQHRHNKLAEALSNCAKAIGDGARTNISTLYLDNFTSTTGISCRSDQEAFDNLLQASHTQGVEIVWEGAPVDFIVDPVISPEFWRRQRERRRLKGDQGK